MAALVFLSLACVAQDGSSVAPPIEMDASPEPVLSGFVAFIPTWDAGQPTLVSIFSPVLLAPVGKEFLIESRGAFEGDFQRRCGTSGDFTGAIDKSVDYLQLDYIGSRYVNITVGRFLTPFNIFNERLYPNWIRNMQTDPLIFSIGTGSDDGVMLRGGIGISKSITVNYAAYFSAASSLRFFESERHAGIRTSLFLPQHRLEIGLSLQHQLQNQRLNRSGFHLVWQPLRVPLEIRSEAVYSRLEGSGFWTEAAFRFRNSGSTALRRAQVVARTQVFNTGEVVGLNPDLPVTDEKRTEAGLNYYITDGWKALASYGRTFTPVGDSNIWTVGMTYRFVWPLGRNQQ